MSSSSSTSSPLCPGPFDSQRFHRVFPTTLPCRQHNILYAAVLQQPSLILEIEQQSLYEEDESLQSLVHIFHHLVSTQMYLATLEPRTDHILSSTLHLMSAIDDTLDLLHDHGFHHHILSLPPRNLTLTCLFRPIYRTLMVVEQDAYEESDMRLINHHVSPPFVLPVPAPPVAHAPPAMVLFSLFLFLPLTFAFVLTAVAVLCKPGCAVRAADTSSV